MRNPEFDKDMPTKSVTAKSNKANQKMQAKHRKPQGEEQLIKTQNKNKIQPEKLYKCKPSELKKQMYQIVQIRTKRIR